MRRPLVLVAALAAAFAGGADASAADRIADAQLRAPAGTAPAACLTELTDGPGVAQRAVRVPAAGTLTARTAGAGDWDVAVFDGLGRRLAAAAGPGAGEVASGLAPAAGTVTVQACRVGGAADDLTLTVDHERLPAPDLTAPPVQLVDVIATTRAARERVANLGLDLTEHAGKDTIGVVLHSQADRDLLLRNGLRWRIVEDDLVAKDLADRRADARFGARAAASALPSGRTTYRELADYEAELKQLAADNPTLVKLITLPHKTFEGRSVLGIEITENVNADDGKPAFFNMGVHHAREWPAGEMTMEWAQELVRGYKAGDARATNVVKRSRNIVVPIVNPDGFNMSRTTSGAQLLLNGEGQDETIDDLVLIATRLNEYRRKNCRVADGVESGPACPPISAGLAEPGVDPNRNYGAFWGGAGADQTNPLAQTYPGAGPFSEPESRNVRDVVASNQVMSLITNHTTAGLVLRAPGIASLGDSVDEGIYKALGDAMAKENGYFSQKSFELYDTTGTTEDWSYNVTGGLGFTFEIYCGTLNYQTGDCDDPAFHPRYARVVEEWEGTSPQADHVQDPADPSAGYDGKGNREAYYLAAESAIDEAKHSILEGSAPAGATLRLKKAFKTETSPQEDGNPIVFDDQLEDTYTVPASGAYRWHVNPSTRPVVAKTTKEAYTMTCEVGGQVLETKAVTVDRGQVVRTDFPACVAAAPPAAAAAATTPAATTAPTACVAANGLRSASAKPSGAGVAFSFARRVSKPVTIDVFQQSRGRTITGERLVARFASKAKGFTWDGRANRRGRSIGDGFYFARYRIATPNGPDTRRIVLQRTNGRFTVRRAFHQRASCRLVRGFKLTRPVFGGTQDRALGVATTVSRAATVRVTVLRGAKVVKRFAAAKVAAGKTVRRSLAAKGLERGDYRVRAQVTAGSGKQTVTLTSRRL